MVIPEIGCLHHVSLSLICQWVDPPASELVPVIIIPSIVSVSALIYGL